MSKTYARPVRLRIKSSTLAARVEQKSKVQQRLHEGTDVPEVQDAHVVEKQAELATSTTISHERRQIKELLRLSNIMQAGLGLDEVLRHVVASIALCTGFSMSVICLLEDDNEHVVPIAFTGTSEENERLIRDNPVTRGQMYRLMHPQYRISQSYFIPHQQFMREFPDVVVTNLTRTITEKELQDESGHWHPQDIFITPLVGSQKQQLLGFISLDEPIDDRIPTLESVEMVELFANQAAIAIDNARIFEERERERVALEQGIAALREDIEQIRHGNFRVHVRSLHPQLNALSEAVNENLASMRSIMSDMWTVTQSVNELMRGMQQNSVMLVRDTSQHEQLIQRVSQVFETITMMMQHVSENAVNLLAMTGDTREVTQVGQESVDRVVNGIGKVRERMMQTARSIKRLSESGQEMSDTMSSIGDMSARLHLISLNAAIEAARAGEQGQGFAVVAQELRSLSLTCSEAARKINGYMRTIQQETTFATQNVEQNTQNVVMQAELVAQTSVTLDAIRTVTDGMASLVQQISTTADHQVQETHHISHTVHEMSQTTSEVKTLMQASNDSMSHLVELSNSLRSRIERLHLGE